jgi:hypothetical protein
VPVIPKRISDIKPLITNLAQTSHYQVQFGAMPLDGALSTYLLKKGISRRFIGEDVGLLCYSAILPTSNLATANIRGNFTGITENFAHTRQYDTISLDFYVDKRYNAIKFFESWMEFISSGSTNPVGLDGENVPISINDDGYFSRMQYPEFYKVNSVRIIKFDRDYEVEIEYNFRGLFPSSISSMQVSYVSSDILKMSVTFNYDRYISGKSTSLSQFIGNNNNNLDNLEFLKSPLSINDIAAKSAAYNSLYFDTNLSNNINALYGSNNLSSQANGAVSDWFAIS